MGLRTTLKIGLILLAGAGLAAIVWSLSSRSGGSGVPSTELLDPGISRQSTDFEHTEFKLGKTLFRVRSTVDTLTALGEHELHDVGLTVYGKDGEATDEISGETATYAVEEKRIEFRGRVEARLSDGTRILSDRLHADLAAETVSIEEDFRFERGQVRGSGRKMLYRIASKSLEINSDFLLENPVSPGAFRATGARAVYNLADSSVNLTGNARLLGSGYQLSGEGMAVDLTGDRRVERVVDTGGARLELARKVFEGERMEFAFEPVSAQLRQFSVLGGEQGSRQPALYLERMPGGVHRLQARRITAVPVSGSREPETLQLEKLRAEREVRFDSTALGIERATSSTLDGAFDGEGVLRVLRMNGGVDVERVEGDRTDRLQSRRLLIEFDQSQRMERVLAFPYARLSMVSPEVSRYHSAKGSMEIGFRDGKISRINSSGGCEVRSNDRDGRSSVQADGMKAFYDGGVINSVEAAGSVRVLLEEAGKTRHTESRSLRLDYEGGRLARATQSGDFHYWERDPSFGLDLRADGAVLDPGADTVVAQAGGRRPRLTQTTPGGSGEEMRSVTDADRFEIDRSGGRVTAVGNVETRLDGQERPLRIVAARMAADPPSGLVEYTGSPRVLDGPNFIAGKVVRLRSQDQSLVSEGDVESFFSSGVGDKLKEYRIAADKVEMQRSANKAVYEGAVRAKSDDLTLLAPFLELQFAEGGMEEVKLATAWGGVQVEDASRKATGEKAFYEPSEKKVRVVGEQAQVVDSKQGKATGRVLTFYLGDERVLIEGPANPKP